MPSAVVSPMPPGQAWPAGNAEMLANTLALPAGETWTMVVPVPCTLALSLKLLTRMSPAVSRPPEAGTTATPYGFTSPLAGTVEATWVRPCNCPRNDATGCGDDVGFALVVFEPAGLEAGVDEQAVAARPRPIMAVRILARLRGFTVLPSQKASALHVQLESLRPAGIRTGQAASPAHGPDLIHERASDVVQVWPPA